MSELLNAPPRKVTRIEFKSRPDLKIETHILTLKPSEFFVMGAALKDKKGPLANLGVELEHQLCDAEAKLLLRPGEGEQFVETLNLRDMRALRDLMDAENALSDPALEKTEKN